MDIFAVIGIVWALFFMLRIFLRAQEHTQNVQKLREHADKMIRVVALESLDSGTILAFDKENNEFLGQGVTEEEVKKRIIERFPEKVFVLKDNIFSGIQGNIEVKLANKITSSNAR
jgi:hypothetical protein